MQLLTILKFGSSVVLLDPLKYFKIFLAIQKSKMTNKLFYSQLKSFPYYNYYSYGEAIEVQSPSQSFPEL